MGFPTLHEIRIINKYNTRRNLEILNHVIKKVSGHHFDIIGSALTNYNKGGFEWCNVTDDMMKVSKLLPQFQIQIQRKEENGVIWNYIYKNKDAVYFDFNDFSEEPDSNSDFCEEIKSNHCSFEKKEK